MSDTTEEPSIGDKRLQHIADTSTSLSQMERTLLVGAYRFAHEGRFSFVLPIAPEELAMLLIYVRRGHHEAAAALVREMDARSPGVSLLTPSAEVRRKWEAVPAADLPPPTLPQDPASFAPSPGGSARGVLAEDDFFWRDGERWLREGGREARLLDLAPHLESDWRRRHPEAGPALNEPRSTAAAAGVTLDANEAELIARILDAAENADVFDPNAIRRMRGLLRGER